MRIAPWWVAGLALATIANAQSSDAKLSSREMTRMLLEMEQWRAQYRKADSVAKRADELKPAYRAEPLRYVNISDEELRQVELITVKYLPRATVNISPVVTNCPCEEGPMCSAQVYVVANTEDESKAIQLSLVKDQWMVGVVQQWWLRREAMHVPKPGSSLPERYRYERALHELFSEFPACINGLVKKAEVKK